MSTNPERHVDVSALQDLKEIMESEFETLIDTFIADSTNKLEELAAAIAASDADALRKVAHSLKGSSSNICAGELSELARQLEFMGKEGTTSGAAAILQQLRGEFITVAAILQKNI
ncbi:MAG: Hpt domain-containing protein [Gammaproteobacteria bacterium]|nr:Hpt domain-containing protein [Gammaproteobacteria bacterium]